MKVYTQLFLASALGLTLSACGGGGGSNGSSGGGNPDPDPNPVNSPPTISITAPDLTRVGDDFLLAPTWSDPNDDRPLFTIENQPDWLDFDSNTGELSGVPTDSNVEIYEDIVITISDGEFEDSTDPFSLTVLYAPVTRESISNSANANVTETPEGFDVEGDTMILVGGVETVLNNADLQFEFDEEGNLIDLVGFADLPPEITETLSLDASVSVQIGLYTGEEINTDPDIGPESERGILLRDEFLYFVYRFAAGVDLTIRLGDGEDEELSLGVGPSADVYIVSDPTDPFFYYYGSLTAGSTGFGYSLAKQIPYEPIEVPEIPVEVAPLDGFVTGQAVLKGTFPFGFFGPFSLFEYQGTAVCSPPQLLDCGKPSLGGLLTTLGKEHFLGDGIDESQQFAVGINGTTAFQVSLLGFIEFFEYHLFDASATVDIGTDLQQLAMVGVIDPQESEQPAWMPFEPVPASDDLMVASIFASMETEYSLDPTSEDGVSLEVTGGDFGISLYGEFDSSFPEARMSGQAVVDENGMTLLAVIDDSENPLTVSATVDSDGMEALVDVTYDISGNINTVVNDGFDRAIDAVNEALAELDDATADYNGAVSLNGFRSQIPGIIDTEIIPALNAVPQRVYDRVFTITRDGINDPQYCYTADLVVGSITRCANEILDANAEATASATTTRNIAQADVAALIAELEGLRVEAERADDTPAFRTALQNALNRAVSMYTYNQSVLIRREINFPSPIPDRTITFFNGNVVITPTYSAATRDDLTLAASNVDDIDPAQTVVVDTQAFVDSLPAEEAIEEARTEVNNGLRVIPSFDGVGYTRGSDFSQSVFVVLDGERIEAEFNPLDPVSVVANIGELIANSLTDD